MQRFSKFFDFVWIFHVRFKMRSKLRAWPFLASCWILEFFWCLSDKIDTLYLKIIFRKNKKQTMWQLQFKFDPLPTESAGICLFHERWIKTFYTQPFCQLCIKYGLVFYKNDLVQFCNNYLVVPSQKNLLSGTRKMENGFFVQRKWKLP